ncbi:MAG TPA: hypothetical protein VM658_08885 [bacterium]|nr:hypothetical protein [bacterium]
MSAEPNSRDRGDLVFLGLIVLLVVLVFAQCDDFFLLNAGKAGVGPGFPIDDAYIFKRYAENIAAGAGFSFNPHELSFGCTSLLWPVLMAALTWLLPSLDYVTIAFATGALLLMATACGAAGIVMRRTRSLSLAFVAGLMLAASPLMLMNSISGMETPLTFALLTALAALVLSKKPHPLAAGAVAGLLTLNRPEGAYFAVAAVIAWAMLRAWGDRRLPAITLVKFLAPWAALTLPPAFIIHHYTGSFLPGTYLGKIMSTSPGVLHRGLVERAAWALINLGGGWLQLAAYLRLLAAAAALLIIYETGRIIYRMYRARAAQEPGPDDAWPLAGELMLTGYLFLPAAYGFSFPVGPAFGGYYIRYIAPVMVAAVILAMLGLGSLSRFLAGRQSAFSRYRRYWLFPALIVFCAYQGWLWSFQVKDARSVFTNEVRLNEGLRMDAAEWIAKNTPADAKVMAGYTGLGVVGGNCNRYVLDLGALINPDILSYYRDARRDPQGRWRAIVSYMRDRGVTWYVTFAFTPEYADKIADPAKTPGFSEAARLGAPGEPSSPYQQIRIYKIDWRQWEAEAGPR